MEEVIPRDLARCRGYGRVEEDGSEHFQCPSVDSEGRLRVNSVGLQHRLGFGGRFGNWSRCPASLDLGFGPRDLDLCRGKVRVNR